MNCEQIIAIISTQCDALRTHILAASVQLTDYTRRLNQIVKQIQKNIEVRDTAFSEEFNIYCANLRAHLDTLEPVWTNLRAQAREQKKWDGALTLDAKKLSSRAKALSRACDEFTTAYDLFNKQYTRFTAAKLSVWLLTSCQTDIANLTGKILFLAREISRKTEQNRIPHANG